MSVATKNGKSTVKLDLSTSHPKGVDERDARATSRAIHQLLQDHRYKGIWHLAIKTQVKGSGSTPTFRVLGVDRRAQKLRIRTQARGNGSCWESYLTPPQGLLLDEIRTRLSRPPRPLKAILNDKESKPKVPRVPEAVREETRQAAREGVCEAVQEAASGLEEKETSIMGFTTDPDNVWMAIYAISEKIKVLGVTEIRTSVAMEAIREACGLEHIPKKSFPSISRYFRNRGYLRDGVEPQTIQLTEVGRLLLNDRKESIEDSSMGDIDRLATFIVEASSQYKKIEKLESDYAQVQDDILELKEGLQVCQEKEEGLKAQLDKARSWCEANQKKIDMVKQAQEVMKTL